MINDHALNFMITINANISPKTSDFQEIKLLFKLVRSVVRVAGGMYILDLSSITLV